MTAHVRVPRPLEPRDPERSAFLADVVAGLSQSPKRIPPKYFYDERGSQLFEAITRTPEYYPTRVETGILTSNAADITQYIPAGAALIEFGAGSIAKARILLATASVGAFVPVDISGTFLTGEAARLRTELPNLRIEPVVADFTRAFELPAAIEGLPRVGFFPGSTLGNFEPHEACAFLRHAGRMLGPGGTLIIGIDLVKDSDVLNRAYNDAGGITAEFNRNLLRRINRELGADFDVEAFWHRAFYNRELSRIEMHLASRGRQRVRIDGRSFEFRRGESIHTENSYKYTPDLFRTLAAGSGWRAAAMWTDPDQWFSVHTLVNGWRAVVAVSSRSAPGLLRRLRRLAPPRLRRHRARSDAIRSGRIDVTVLPRARLVAAHRSSLSTATERALLSRARDCAPYAGTRRI